MNKDWYNLIGVLIFLVLIIIGIESAFHSSFRPYFKGISIFALFYVWVPKIWAYFKRRKK